MLNRKIKKIGALKKIVSGLKRRKKKIVFTNGCFDILHYGHAKYLRDAKRKGDILIVGVNSDSSVREIKGKNRPIICEADRIALIAALESVDYAVLFKEKTPINLIQSLRPDILVKGADWNKNDIAGANLVSGWGGKIYRVKLSAGRSSTKIIKKIAALS